MPINRVRLATRSHSVKAMTVRMPAAYSITSTETLYRPSTGPESNHSSNPMNTPPPMATNNDLRAT